MVPAITDKTAQAEYYDHAVADPEFEINRPHGESRLYRYLMDFKFKRVIQLLGGSLAGKRVLVVCCGSGMDAEYLARGGAHVVALDISTGCLIRARERGRRYGLDFTLVGGDAENLPFHDDSFDYAFVHDGLHHLASPERAVREMSRIAATGIVISEPAKAAVTGIPTRIGVMKAYEDAGNFINRLSPKNLERTCRSLGFDHVAYSRYLMKYGHPPATWWHVFDREPLFTVAWVSFRILGVALLGRWGNKLAFVAERSVPQTAC